MSIQIGTVIDERYRIVARIGHGGMAEVYEGLDIILKKRLAMKFIREDVMSNPINIKRFTNEATTAAQLNHPNIVRIYNHGVYQNRPFIVFEYVNGQSLKEVLDFRTHLSIQETIDIMIQICDALNCAHNHGIVHRDIKPDNIFYLNDGSIKLGDFGIAQCNDFRTKDGLTSADGLIGSVHYMAPEISQGKLATVQSDIYAAGVTMFEILTGHVPFEKDSPVDVCVAHIKEPFPSIRKYLPNFPKEVEHIVNTATKKDFNQRYQSALDMKRDLIEVKNKTDLIKEKRSLLSRIFGFK